MTRIFVADTETTGFGPTARIVEYSHVECQLIGNRLEVKAAYETLVNPGIPIPEQASKIHGINDAMVANAPSIKDILPEALNVAKNEYAEYYGHNLPGYDMQYLDGFIPKSFEVGCSLKAARKLLSTKKHSLDFLRELMGFPDVRAHSAIGDCHSTVHLINYMLAGGEHTNGVATAWEALAEIMQEKPTKITFGKHKDTQLADLPEDYVRWLLNKCDNVSYDLRRALLEL